MNLSEAGFGADHWDVPLTPRECRRLDRTVALIPADVASLLDVGCGDGRLLGRLQQTGRSVPRRAGVDLSTAGLGRALARFPVGRASCTDLPFRAGSFDCIVCSEVLEHLDRETTDRAAEELQRVARRYLLITVPYREQLDSALTRCPECGFVFHVYGHCASYDQANLATLFPGMSVRKQVLIERRLVRPWSPRLSALKFERLGLWTPGSGTACPRCGNESFPPHGRRTLRAVLRIANLLSPVPPRWGGWLAMLFEKSLT